jgi:hypothetical protein
MKPTATSSIMTSFTNERMWSPHGAKRGPGLSHQFCCLERFSGLRYGTTYFWGQRNWGACSRFSSRQSLLRNFSVTAAVVPSYSLRAAHPSTEVPPSAKTNRLGVCVSVGIADPSDAPVLRQISARTGAVRLARAARGRPFLVQRVPPYRSEKPLGPEL